MKIPAVPTDEATRLRDLHSHNILDTPNEDRLDRLVRLAKCLFHVPIAAISLVDEHRQWLKSRDGIDFNEISRDISFCAHTILGDEILVVADASEDDRFADNPMVLNGPKVRFYAGCPITSANGHRLGSLCIIDRVPRHFSDAELDTLKDLGRIVEREIAVGQVSIQDEISRLNTRRGFCLIADHALNICVRLALPASLVIFQLHHFNQGRDGITSINGTVPRIFASLMKINFRDSDIYGRFHANQFGLLINNARKHQAERVIQRFETALKVHNEKYGGAGELAFSCSIVQFDPEKHHTVEALLADGEAAMFEGQKASA